MKKTISMLGIVLCCYGTPLIAEIEPARDLMEQGHFTEAMQALLPAARAGNADAEELIGCLLYTSPSPRDKRQSRMPSSA